MLVVVHVQLSVAKSGKITTAEMKGKIPDEKINSYTLIKSYSYLIKIKFLLFI